MAKDDVVSLIKAAASGFMADKALTFAAALSYYAVFAIAPLFLIIIAVAGFVFGSDAARTELTDRVGGAVGQSGREVVEMLLKNAAKPGSGAIGSITGAVLAIIGATGLFAQVKDALNQVWDVKAGPGRTLIRMIKTRVLGFLMVLGISLGLMALLAASTAISAFDEWIKQYVPIPSWALGVIDLGVSFGLVLTLMMVIYKFLPDAIIGWREAWTGAAITSLLFAIGKVGLGLYLGHSSMGSVYGAAGSLVVVLVWIYYSAAIFLFGAELTRCHAAASGQDITPAQGAVWAHVPALEPVMPWRKNQE